MKKTYPLVMLALLVITLSACKKDKGDNKPNELVGTWELAEYSTSWMPVKTYEHGNGNLLEIKSDTYAFYKDGQVQENGNYTTEADTSVEENVCLVNQGKYRSRFDFINPTPSRTIYFKTFFYIEGNRLYMTSGCEAIDANVTSVYRRINPIAID